MNRMNLATRRLILRPVSMADVRAFYEHSIIPEVAEKAGFLPNSMAETRKYIGKSVAEWKKPKPERMTFSILLKAKKTWIGSLELRMIYEGIYEIGFFIHPQHWGNGYATEAGKAALRLAFTRCKAHRVQGSCWVKNPAAIRVVRKLGLCKEGRLRGYAKVGDTYQDDLLFGMILSDWRTAACK